MVEDTAGDLTPEQQKAIATLLTVSSVQDAAKKLRIAHSTIYQWLKRPVFKSELRRQRKVVMEAALSGLTSHMKDAVTCLKRNLKCGAPTTEVRAALGILDKAINGQAMADMQAEIEALREQLEKRDAEPGVGTSGDQSVAGTGADGNASHPPQLPGNVAPVDRPDATVPPGQFDPRSVAGGVPGGPEPAPDDPGLPASGEDGGVGSEDADPLFDAP